MIDTPHDQRAIQRQPGFDVRQIAKAPDKKQRGNDQRQRHGDLADDESTLKPRAVTIHRQAAR
jgi:hypothetical protein